MIETDLNKIKNNGILTLLPDYDIDQQESFQYMFGETIVIHNNVNKGIVHSFIEKTNKKLSQLILVNYSDVYRDILPYISSKIKVKWIFTHYLADLTNAMLMDILRTILTYYDRGLVSKIGCFDHSMYLALKKSKHVTDHILPDIQFSPKKSPKSKDIAIISNDYDVTHSYYNILSAFQLIDYKRLKINPTLPVTKQFVEIFNIKTDSVLDIERLEANNELNLYVNFTNSKYYKVLKSMDRGIPCIVGNINLFNSNKVLKSMLVMESTDDINEIARRIECVRKNKELILKEYSKFRQDYIKKSKKSLEKFFA